MLPLLLNEEQKSKILKNPTKIHQMNSAEQRHYRGFDSFLEEKSRNTAHITIEQKTREQQQNHELIRAAFFVDWDPQSLYSLQTHIQDINTLIPEWLSINPDTLRLETHIDPQVLTLANENHIRVLPLLSNMKGGDFDTQLVHIILSNPEHRAALIGDISATLQSNHLAGINIDFENLAESDKNLLVQFQ